MARVPRKVIVQPADPSLDKKNVNYTKAKLKVTYYARVSTNEEDQQLSYEAQNEYYVSKILANPNWTYVQGYADNGISGTNTAKREQFNKMIEDCKAGKIDIILTKSISRFARNTVDTLTTVRDLQRIGVSVIFEKENIDTSKQDCEMLLTIFGSLAQEESRSMSENIKWGIKAKFESGEIMMCTSRFLGLDRNEHGELVINEEQAKVVRLIAMLYLSGMSCEEIAKELQRRGIKTVTGKDKWCASTIGSILRNEKYAGYAIQGKSYTVDFLTKKRVKNIGQRPKYKALGSVPAILPMNIYMKIQEEMARRSMRGHSNVDANNHEKIKRGKYALTELLRCAECGNTFRRVSWKLGGKNIPVYRCKSTQVKGRSCRNSPTLRETDIERNVLMVIAEMKKEDTDEKINKIVLKNIKTVLEKDTETDMTAVNEKIIEVKKTISELIERGMNGFEQDPEVDTKIVEQGFLLKQLQERKKRMMENSKSCEKVKQIEEYMDNNVINMKKFDNAMMRRMIERIIVNEDATIEIHFNFGGIVIKQLEKASARR